MKKCLTLGFALFLASAFFPSSVWAQYRAEDISVPPGYKVIKVAESNRITEPYRLAFDSSGNLISGSFGFMFFKVDPVGGVGILGKSRKYTIVPGEVEPAPGGAYVIRSLVYEKGKEVYRFTPPDGYVKVLEANNISAIGYDRLGNFYAALQETNTSLFTVVRYDADFLPAETTMMTGRIIVDFCFDAQKNLYVLQRGTTGDPAFRILKVPAGDNGIPGPEDTPVVFAQDLSWAYNMAIDDAGNIFTDAYIRTDVNGFSAYEVFRLEKTDSTGRVVGKFGPELPRPGGLAYRDGFIYVSEWARNVVSRIDLTTGEKADFTEDFGLAAAGPVAFDVNDNLYTHVFREYRLLRMNEDGSFSQVGEGTGYAQSIASDGTYFYLGSSPLVGSNGNQILRIEPLSGTTEVMATKLGGWRLVTFDSFGRLVLCSIINEIQNQFRADIIDRNTEPWTATPYVTGLHNKGRGLAFDARQNLYAVEGIGDGIKKVALFKDMPRDISLDPLFYDLRPYDPVPPTIYFIAVNDEEEVFIPRIDSGDVLLGNKDGHLDFLARGLINPTTVTIDKYGALFISDSGNGIFKIVHERWTVPAVIKLNETLLAEIRLSAVVSGTKDSLVSKLKNADKRLNEHRVTPAIQELEAFVNEVRAQSGKKIPSDLAARWITAAKKIIQALREID